MPTLTTTTHKNANWLGTHLHQIGNPPLPGIAGNLGPNWRDEATDTTDAPPADGTHPDLADALARRGLLLADLACTNCGAEDWRANMAATIERSTYLDLSNPTAPHAWDGDPDYDEDYLEWTSRADWECTNCGDAPTRILRQTLTDIADRLAEPQ